MPSVWSEGRGSAAAVWDVDEQAQVSQGGPSWERKGCRVLAVKKTGAGKIPLLVFQTSSARDTAKCTHRLRLLRWSSSVARRVLLRML